MKLNGKTILITGASSGFGKAVALRCADDDCTLILSARNKDKLAEVEKLLKEKNPNVSIRVIPADVTKVNEIRELFLQSINVNGHLDVVFNNAGLGHIAELKDLNVEQIQQMIDVNITGMIMVSKFASEVMTRQKYGHIIMSSSLAGLISVPQWSVYVASKWAITGFAACLAMEMKKYQVMVTTIHPGPVKTEFFDKEKANVDLAKLQSVIPVETVADTVYDAIFKTEGQIPIPFSSRIYGTLYRFMPKLVQKMILGMSQEVKYHELKKEDEPLFSKVMD
jgi:short-subunit dehydrogenase